MRGVGEVRVIGGEEGGAEDTFFGHCAGLLARRWRVRLAGWKVRCSVVEAAKNWGRKVAPKRLRLSCSRYL